MVETWLYIQPFHWEGVVSAILVDNFIGKRKKKFLDFWFLLVLPFWVPVREEERKPQRSKKNNCRKKTQKIGEEGKLENAEEAG